MFLPSSRYPKVMPSGQQTGRFRDTMQTKRVQRHLCSNDGVGFLRARGYDANDVSTWDTRYLLLSPFYFYRCGISWVLKKRFNQGCNEEDTLTLDLVYFPAVFLQSVRGKGAIGLGLFSSSFSAERSRQGCDWTWSIFQQFFCRAFEARVRLDLVYFPAVFLQSVRGKGAIGLGLFSSSFSAERSRQGCDWTWSIFQQFFCRAFEARVRLDLVYFPAVFLQSVRGKGAIGLGLFSSSFSAERSRQGCDWTWSIFQQFFCRAFEARVRLDLVYFPAVFLQSVRGKGAIGLGLFSSSFSAERSRQGCDWTWSIFQQFFCRAFEARVRLDLVYFPAVFLQSVRGKGAIGLGLFSSSFSAERSRQGCDWTWSIFQQFFCRAFEARVRLDLVYFPAVFLQSVRGKGAIGLGLFSSSFSAERSRQGCDWTWSIFQLSGPF